MAMRIFGTCTTQLVRMTALLKRVVEKVPKLAPEPFEDRTQQCEFSKWVGWPRTGHIGHLHQALSTSARQNRFGYSFPNPFHIRGPFGVLSR